MMKRLLGIVAVLCLLAMTFTAVAVDYTNVAFFGWGYEMRLDAEKVPVRTGPSTEFTERATYTVNKVRLISKSMDNKGTVWVQVELSYAGKKTRGYTNRKKLVDACSGPWETTFNQLGYRERVNVSSSQWAYTGPGYDYMRSDDFYLYSGVDYYLVGLEGNWALVQTRDTGYPMWRGWVPLNELY